MYLAGEKERLFAAEITPTPDEPPPADPRARRRKGQKSVFAENRDVLWSVPGDLQVRGMVLAGTDEGKRLIIAGAKGDWVTSTDAYDGKLGGVLRVVSIKDGSTIAEQDLPGLPVFDGMSAAGGRLFLSLRDGRVVCLGAADR